MVPPPQRGGGGERSEPEGAADPAIRPDRITLYLGNPR